MLGRGRSVLTLMTAWMKGKSGRDLLLCDDTPDWIALWNPSPAGALTSLFSLYSDAYFILKDSTIRTSTIVIRSSYGFLSSVSGDSSERFLWTENLFSAFKLRLWFSIICKSLGNRSRSLNCYTIHTGLPSLSCFFSFVCSSSVLDIIAFASWKLPRMSRFSCVQSVSG